MHKVYFQIGTNDGNDLFRDMVLEQKPDLIILVEPNKALVNSIKQNYLNIKNVHIYNNAIYYNNDEDVKLVIPAKNGILGRKAENGYTYSTEHFTLLPMNNWGNKDDMVKITSKSITFDKICSIHNITNIDYLQIDTEGFDSEIIKMIDLSKYKIKTIRFEPWMFKSEDFTRYNKEKSNELGEAGTIKSIKKLIKHNYKIERHGDYFANLIE